MSGTYKTTGAPRSDDEAMTEPPIHPEDLPVRFDTKIAVLVGDDLETWQRLNVTAFLVSGIAAAHPELMGEPYEDADGTTYLPLLGQPILIFEADDATLKAAHGRALGRGLPMSVYTREMFATGHDAANRAVV